MVFFTCNACGESLKKGQVEKHTAICRNCQCLSCIDCGKDFWGEDYKQHLKCISEDQKYGGKAFEGKANKGDVKQQQWIQRIQEVMKKPSISSNMRNILNQISTYDNIPRKKAKFQNWMKNSLKIHNKVLQDQVWEIFSEATSGGADKEKQAETTPCENESTTLEAEDQEKKKSKRERKEERQKQNKKEKKELNLEEQVENGGKKKGKKRKMEEDDETEARDDGSKEEKRKKKKKKPKSEDDMEDNVTEANGNEEDAPTSKKKRKHKESEDESTEQQNEENAAEENCESNGRVPGKFNWKGTIKALLKQAPDNELPIKKLRKKVLAQYFTVSSTQHKSEEDLLSTFNKKIHNNPKFRVLKERVKLLK